MVSTMHHRAAYPDQGTCALPRLVSSCFPFRRSLFSFSFSPAGLSRFAGANMLDFRSARNLKCLPACGGCLAAARAGAGLANV